VINLLLLLTSLILWVISVSIENFKITRPEIVLGILVFYLALSVTGILIIQIIEGKQMSEDKSDNDKRNNKIPPEPLRYIIKDYTKRKIVS
jgi:hypothetical protein